MSDGVKMRRGCEVVDRAGPGYGGMERGGRLLGRRPSRGKGV